jgi:hypothetical protein
MAGEGGVVLDAPLFPRGKSRNRMRFAVVDAHDHLRIDLFDRETAEETEEFLRAIEERGLKHPSSRVLICVHSSRAIFQVEKYHASMFIAEVAARPSLKVALVATQWYVRIAHEYVELLARLKGANIRSFAQEWEAIQWLIP